MFSYNIMEDQRVPSVVESISNEPIDKEKKEENKESMYENISTSKISISEITELANQLNELYRIVASGELKSAYLPQSSPME